MIPVLGIPVLNRFDLLSRLLSSVDPDAISSLWLVDNRPCVDTRPLWQVCTHLERFRHRLHVIRTGYNLGVSASWNQIIRATPAAPYWLICNDDVVFTPNGLSRIEEYVIPRLDTQSVMTACGFSSFVMTPLGISTVGWFDENFWPAYYEDNDWHRRSGLLRLQDSSIPDVIAEHGNGGMASSTITSLATSASLKAAHHFCMTLNGSYYCEKWGGLPGAEQFTRAFNTQEISIRDWTLNLSLLARKRMEFDAAVLGVFWDSYREQ